MASFKKYYRDIFTTLGHPLTNATGIPSEELSRHAKRLGVRIPRSLRDYYAVAGREKLFNRCHNRLLAPKNCSIDKRNLIFMEENQAVVLWSVSTRSSVANDPAVFQAVNDEPITWVREHKKCSVFLGVMLHYQAVSGGFRYVGSAPSPDNLHEKLKVGWTFIGEVNQLWAFSRRNQVVCVMFSDLPFQPAMMIRAGGKTKADLHAIEDFLSVSLR